MRNKPTASAIVKARAADQRNRLINKKDLWDVEVVDDGNSLSYQTDSPPNRAREPWNFKKECAKRSPAALEALCWALEQRKSIREVVEAAKVILSYAHGKPVEQSVQFKGTLNPLDIVKEIEARKKSISVESRPLAENSEDSNGNNI